MRTAYQRGFTTLELAIVSTMLLTIAAAAIPALSSVLGDVRLRADAQTLVSMLQETRMQAIRDDASYSLVSHTTLGVTRLFVDSNHNGQPEPTEPTALLSHGMLVEAGGTNLGVPAALGFVPQTTDPAFNARGVPCVFTGRACSTAPGGQVAGFFLIIQDDRALGRPGAIGVSVAPSGRIQTWAYQDGIWLEVQSCS